MPGQFMEVHLPLQAQAELPDAKKAVLDDAYSAGDATKFGEPLGNELSDMPQEHHSGDEPPEAREDIVERDNVAQPTVEPEHDTKSHSSVQVAGGELVARRTIEKPVQEEEEEPESTDVREEKPVEVIRDTQARRSEASEAPEQQEPKLDIPNSNPADTAHVSEEDAEQKDSQELLKTPREPGSLLEPFDPANDFDHPWHRRESLPGVHAALQDELSTAKEVLETGDPEQLKDFLLRSPDKIARATLGATGDEDIYSGKMRTSVKMNGDKVTAWVKPQDAERLESEIIDGLVGRYDAGEIGMDRVAKGIYMSEIMRQKRIDANHRVARSEALVLSRAAAGAQEISAHETAQLLCVDADPSDPRYHDPRGLHLGRDTYHMTAGVAHFAKDKLGLGYEEIVSKLGITDRLPEDGLTVLASRFGIEDYEGLKEAYVRYMTTESDLSWCKFEYEEIA
jgi:hypothetical protein